MIFAHDTEEGLAGMAALVNTANREPDGLPDVAALDAFVRTWGWTGSRTHDEAELRAVRALRPRLRALWEAGDERLAELANAMLREGRALPQLVKHDGWDYHLHATSAGVPLATRMSVEAAMAIVDVVRQKERERLRICAYPGCGNVLIDLSKNRSKRFCDDGCGNRAAVEAYRARKAAASRPRRPARR